MQAAPIRRPPITLASGAMLPVFGKCFGSPLGGVALATVVVNPGFPELTFSDALVAGFSAAICCRVGAVITREVFTDSPLRLIASTFACFIAVTSGPVAESVAFVMLGVRSFAIE